MLPVQASLAFMTMSVYKPPSMSPTHEYKPTTGYKLPYNVSPLLRISPPLGINLKFPPDPLLGRAHIRAYGIVCPIRQFYKICTCTCTCSRTETVQWVYVSCGVSKSEIPFLSSCAKKIIPVTDVEVSAACIQHWSLVFVFQRAIERSIFVYACTCRMYS